MQYINLYLFLPLGKKMTMWMIQGTDLPLILLERHDYSDIKSPSSLSPSVTASTSKHRVQKSGENS
jgi:hypothetical protein